MALQRTWDDQAFLLVLDFPAGFEEEDEDENEEDEDVAQSSDRCGGVGDAAGKEGGFVGFEEGFLEAGAQGVEPDFLRDGQVGA